MKKENKKELVEDDVVYRVARKKWSVRIRVLELLFTLFSLVAFFYLSKYSQYFPVKRWIDNLIGNSRADLKPVFKPKLTLQPQLPLPRLVSFSDYKPTPIPPDTSDFTLVAVGDMMLGTQFPSTDYLPNGNILAGVSDLLKDADFTIGNCEGTLCDVEGEVKKCKDVSKCYAFRSPEAYAAYYKEAGFDVLNLANNHSGDFGAEGRKHTQDALTKEGIAYCGLQDMVYTSLTIKGKKVAVLGYAPNKGCASIYDVEAMKAQVKELKATHDLVIVTFHGGAEGGGASKVTRKTEKYVGENRGNPYLFAHGAIDAGADAVIGHGPHIPRAMEVYQGKVIAYSLGNFATYGRFSLKGSSKYAPILKLTFNKQNKTSACQIISCIQKGEGIPEKDPESLALLEIQRCSKRDFPENCIAFDSSTGLLSSPTLPATSLGNGSGTPAKSTPKKKRKRNRANKGGSKR